MNHFPSEISRIIVSYTLSSMHRLRDGIKIEVLKREHLLKNPSDGAVDLISHKPIKFDDWEYLVANSNDRIVDILLRPENRAFWYMISGNSNDRIVNFLLRPENRRYIDIDRLSGNSNDRAVDFLLRPENRPFINWYYLSMNSNDRVVDKLLRPESKRGLNWRGLSKNSNPRIIELVLNPKNRKKIDWDLLSENPAIFILDENFVEPERVKKILDSMSW